MKVLLLADGRSVHTIRYQAELKAQGAKVTLASLERGDTVDIQLKKKSVSNSLNYFFVNREIKELVRKVNPDIVNPHFASGYGFSTAVSKVWRSKPVLLHCLGSDILVSPKKSIAHKRKVILALSRSSHILVDSKYLANAILKLYKAESIDIIPWGVEPAILDIFQKKIRESVSWNKPLKVLVPRPHNPVYNNEFIVESLKELINIREIALWFPNWGDDLDDFKSKAKRICPDGLITYYNFLTRDNYIEFLKQFDFYLSASKSDSSPASLIEAMAAGIFPVVADIPGVREWLDGNNGALYPPDDRDALKKIIAELTACKTTDMAQILNVNHERVKRSALFPQNIKETIGIMERLITRGV
ncbi:MAG: glycosyltransferase [Candidatus Zixiibacteriota bacterium]